MRLKDLLLYIVVLIVSLVTRIMPRRLALRLGDLIGDLAYIVSQKRRSIALRNIHMAIGRDLSRSQLQGIARRSFRNMGKNMVELLCLSRYNLEKLLKISKIDGLENFHRAMSKGNGVIAVTGHFGNWELIFHIMPHLTDKFAAVAQPFKNKLINNLTNKHRLAHGGILIDKKNAVKQVTSLLRKGFCVIILADQDAGENGVFVDFFGMPASTARGPIVFALRTGASIIEIFDIRQQDDSHLIQISKPMEIDILGDIEHDVTINTAKMVKHFEELISKYPEQWLWMHNRWKTKKKY